MRIVYLFQDQYPWDIRADKITTSLAEAGHSTYIVSRNRSGLPVNEQLGENRFVRRLPSVALESLRSLINFPAFFSPVWLWRLWRTVVDEKVDIIIVRDLPLGPAAWLIGKLMHVPVVMDMAENYPAMIQDTWDYRGPNIIDYVARNPTMLRWLEAWLLPKLDGLLAVSPASATRVERLGGCSQLPVCVIQNTPRLESATEFSDSEMSQKMAAMTGVKMLYVGGLEEMRGLDIVVAAVHEVLRKGAEVKLVIVGEGTSRSALEQQVSQLNIAEHVIFSGWQNQDYVPGIIAAADFGIVPHRVTEHTNTTLPNKIYDYMAQGKPVIVTQAESLRKMVDSYHCGVWYEDNDSAALAHTLQGMLSNRERVAEMGRNGKLAIQNELNWAVDSIVLLKFLSESVA